MGTKDGGIKPGRNTTYWDVWDFATLADAGLGAGAPALGQFNSLGFIGAIVNAEGDSLNKLCPAPKQWDCRRPMRARVIYGSTSADADVVAFKLHYKAQTLGAAATVTSPTPLSFASDTLPGVANCIVATDWLTIAANTFNRDTIYAFILECDDFGDASADEIYIFGLHIEYEPSIAQL